MSKSKAPAPTVTSAPLALESIHLVESKSRLGRVNWPQMPSLATQRFSITANKGDGGTVVVVELALSFDYEGAEETPPPVSIGASFQLGYRHEELATESLKAALTREVFSDVWPYWREFAQSLGLRMGLPSIPVPPFDLAHLERGTPA